MFKVGTYVVCVRPDEVWDSRRVAKLIAGQVYEVLSSYYLGLDFTNSDVAINWVLRVRPDDAPSSSFFEGIEWSADCFKYFSGDPNYGDHNYAEPLRPVEVEVDM